MNSMIELRIYTGLKEFYEHLTGCLSKPLPGIEAQLRMAPAGRVMEIFTHNERKPLLSSVLIPLYIKKGALTTLFIRRPEYPGIHSGQMAFPGGRHEPEDIDHKHTALRETHEEIGISPNQVQVAGSLTPLYIPPSNYMVYPFVGIIPPDPAFTPDPAEVAEIVEIPFIDLMQPGTIRLLPPAPEFKFLEVPAFVIGNNTIWGATAMILAELIEVFRRDDRLLKPHIRN
jgi:8-oxo-dGTP pyrophosphatase MutT (NUDIX family)